MAIRIAGTSVEARIPGWLMTAAASRSTVVHARRVAHELSSHPERYGFDPGATYTAFVQSWDRAEFNIPSLAFGRNVAGQGAVELWPDPYYIDSRGFQEVRTAAGGVPPWAARSGRVAWRGSVTGAGTFAAPEDIPRIRLAIACRDLAGTDVGLIGVHSTMRATAPFEATERFVAAEGLVRDHWPIADFGRYRYAIDIDGHANAWGLLEKLILGCCVLKVASPFEQWFYPRLRPWVHYVPVEADLSDLAQTIDWCIRHDDQCEWIARNGARLARSLSLEGDLAQSCRAFLSAAHPLRLDPLPQPAVDAIAIEDAAAYAEVEGLLDTAINNCTRLVDMRAGGAPALLRRSGLYSQQGRFPAALHDLERAVAADPGDPLTLVTLANFASSTGRDISAVACLEEARRQVPSPEEVPVLLAACHIRLDRLDEAFRAVRHLSPDLPGWWGDLCRLSTDRYTARRAQARAILRARRDPSGFGTGQAWELAICLHALGRLRAAARLCALVAEHDPASFAPREIASRIVARRDGPAAALSWLAQLPASFHDDAPYRIRRAQLLFDTGEYRQAADLLRDRADVSGDWLARRTLAYAAILLDDRDLLFDHLGSWMGASPDETLPAELTCATWPAPDDRAAGSAGPCAAEIVQFRQDDAAASLGIMESWAAHHPEVRRHVLDEKDARAFLAAEYGAEMAAAFDSCRGSRKAAILRYAWLHRRGGVWIAADRRCLRPATAFLSACAASEIAAVRSGRMDGPLSDGIVGARRGSGVAEAALRATVASADGPAREEDLLTRAVALHLCGRGPGDVLLFAPLQARRFSAPVRMA